MKVVVLLLTLGVVAASGPMKPMDIWRMAALFGCRLNGKDGGIDREFAKAMLGMSSPVQVQKCMLGCVVGWMHSTNNLLQFELGMDLVPKVMMGELTGTTRGCIHMALAGGKKCSIISNILKCVITTENNIMVTKFKHRYFPWLPCWDYLKVNVPVVKTVDKAVNTAKDAFFSYVANILGFKSAPGVTMPPNLPLDEGATRPPEYVNQTLTIGPQPEPPKQPTEAPKENPAETTAQPA